MRYEYIHKTEIGNLKIVEKDGSITEISLSKDEADKAQKETSLIVEAKKQLDEYFRVERKVFDLPLSPQGTEFQQKVWNALLDVPYGEVKSYKDIARAVGNEKASRAIGMANNKNPILIIIPCHRIIGSDGSLVGYGCGLEMKKRLLDLEKANFLS